MHPSFCPKYPYENSPQNNQEALNRISHVIKNPSNTVLDLSHLRLTKLPDLLFRATHITKLDLSFNKLNHIPDDFINLQNLKQLFLFNNYFEYIPEVIFKLDLQYLSFALSKIETLPDDIVKLKNIEFLYLDGNCFTHLPVDSIVKMSKSKLKVIDVKNNPIRNVPVEFYTQGLKGILDFYNNPPPDYIQKIFYAAKAAMENAMKISSESNIIILKEKISKCSAIIYKFYSNAGLKLTNSQASLVTFLCLGFKMADIKDLTDGTKLLYTHDYPQAARLRKLFKLTKSENTSLFFQSQLHYIIGREIYKL